MTTGWRLFLTAFIQQVLPARFELVMDFGANFKLSDMQPLVEAWPLVRIPCIDGRLQLGAIPGSPQAHRFVMACGGLDVPVLEVLLLFEKRETGHLLAQLVMRLAHVIEEHRRANAGGAPMEHAVAPSREPLSAKERKFVKRWLSLLATRHPVTLVCKYFYAARRHYDGC